MNRPPTATNVSGTQSIKQTCTHNVIVFQSTEQHLVHYFFPFFAAAFFLGLAFFLRPRSTQQSTSCQLILDL